MILRKTLEEVVLSQRDELTRTPSGIHRGVFDYVNSDIPHSIIISGIRRCGKSTLLRQIMQRSESPNYLNFEDTRLVEFDSLDFGKLDSVFSDLGNKSGTYFLDEIQGVENWEIYVRSGMDKGRKFFLTGSNASLLTREIGSKLTGRHVNVELFPFSYSEYLLYKGLEAGRESFERYLFTGGFPEYLKYGEEAILRELMTDIVQRDIVARYGLRDSHIVAELAFYMVTNVSREFSYNKLKDVFDLGSANTAKSYVSYLEDSYMLFSVPNFQFSLRKRMMNPRKVYCIDNGFAKANSVSFSSDRGRMLENCVFLLLRRKNRNVFYYKGKGECDFVVWNAGTITAAIQVTYVLNEDNRRMEIGGLVEAMDKFNLASGTIVTVDQVDTLNIGGKVISVVPAWEAFRDV
ncbi:MAG: ATP-binding protein [Thermoplasmataceae archaeon]